MEFDAVGTMGRGDRCGGVQGNNWQDWALPEPKHLPLAEFRQLRGEIEMRVIDLMTTL